MELSNTKPGAPVNVLELILNDMLRHTEEGSFARKLLVAGAEGYSQRMAEVYREPDVRLTSR